MKYWEGEFTYNGDLFYANIHYHMDDYFIDIIEHNIVDIDDVTVHDPSNDMLKAIEMKIERHAETVDME